MGARKHETNQEKFTSRLDVEKLNPGVTVSQLLIAAAPILKKHTSSAVHNKRQLQWGEYKPAIIDGVGYIIRDTCERCGNVHLEPGQRKLRRVKTDLGPIYLDTGICKDCINASIYVDKFLDGNPLSEKDAKALFYKYAREYEHQWRVVLAVAPQILLTDADWKHACRFFGGCALCGGQIEVRHKYFPTTLNGEYTPWNIIPLCSQCAKQYRMVGVRSDPVKAPRLYRVFSTHTYFQKTKTIRLYLLAQMEFYGIYIENLTPYRQRFFEKKILKHSYPTNIPEDLLLEVRQLAIAECVSMYQLCEIIRTALMFISEEEVMQYTGSTKQLLFLDSLIKTNYIAKQLKENNNGRKET